MIVTSSDTQRIEMWDLLKLFAIFAVVLGHSMQHLLDGDATENPLFLWITTFHMPLFMAISGFFSVKSFQRPVKHYLKNRSRQLLLPWVSWSIILAVTISVMDGMITWSGFKSLFIDSLWFLKSLFICGILALLGFKPKGNRIVWVVLSLMISQVCMVWNVFIMYPCFLWGILLAKKFSYIHQHLVKVSVISGVIFFLSSIAISITPGFWIRNAGIRQLLLNGNLEYDLFIDVVLRRYIQLIIGIFGATFFIVLFYGLFSTGKKHNFLASMGRFSLGVYVVQTLILETILPRFVHFMADDMLVFDLLVAPCISVAITAVSLCISLIISGLGGVLATILLGEPIPSKHKMPVRSDLIDKS